MNINDLINRFTYHPPTDDQRQRYVVLREWALNFALKINELTPESREQSLSITALEECVSRANAAIALNKQPGEGIILPDKNTLYPDVLTTSRYSENEGE